MEATAASAPLLNYKVLREYFVTALLTFCGCVSIFTTLGIVYVLVREALPFFAHVSIFDFLFDGQWTPLFFEKHFGIGPLVCGTLLTSAIALSIAVPFGLITAIYLSEFASERARRRIKPALELLAGIPTVVYGYLALLHVTPLLQNLIPSLAGFNALSPGIVMGLMILPLVASLSEDAMYVVPRSLKEGAYALGSTKLQMIFKVLVPSAFGGIAAACILAMSRAVGETMIVAIAAGQQPRLSLNPLQPLETMTAYIVQISLGDTPHGTLEFQTLFAVALMLFLMTLVFNLSSLALRRRFEHTFG